MKNQSKTNEDKKNQKYSGELNSPTLGKKPVKKEEKAIDRSGHYDQDGVSFSEAQGVVVASTETTHSKKPTKH